MAKFLCTDLTVFILAAQKPFGLSFTFCRISEEELFPDDYVPDQ